MTKAKQRAFIRAHTKYIREQMLAKIDAGKVPKHWRELELRWLIFDSYAPEITNLPSDEAARRNKYDLYQLTH